MTPPSKLPAILSEAHANAHAKRMGLRDLDVAAKALYPNDYKLLHEFLLRAFGAEE